MTCGTVALTWTNLIGRDFQEVSGEESPKLCNELRISEIVGGSLMMAAPIRYLSQADTLKDQQD